MQQGYTPGGAETSFTGAANASIVVCSDVFTTGQSMSAGTTTINGYWSNTGGNCSVTATIYKNGTSLGSASNNVGPGAATTLRTWSIPTSAASFSTGDRLDVKLALGAGACSSGGTVLHYDGSAVPSKVTFPSMP
jgi:hypothetical protein